MDKAFMVSLRAAMLTLCAATLGCATQHYEYVATGGERFPYELPFGGLPVFNETFRKALMASGTRDLHCEKLTLQEVRGRDPLFLADGCGKRASYRTISRGDDTIVVLVAKVDLDE